MLDASRSTSLPFWPVGDAAAAPMFRIVEGLTHPLIVGMRRIAAYLGEELARSRPAALAS